MSNTNEVCREILNSRDVIMQRMTEVLLADLVAPGAINKKDAVILSKKVEEVLHRQTQQLVDRVMKLAD